MWDLSEVQVDDRDIVGLAKMVAKEPCQLDHLYCKPQLEMSNDCTETLSDLGKVQ